MWTVLRDGTKKCSVCGVYKPINEFYSNKARSTGTYPACILCFKPSLEYPKAGDYEIVYDPNEFIVETWKTVSINDIAYPYEISDLGRLYSVKRKMICRPSFDQRGYPQVILYGDNRASRRLHRLVAEAYIPNPLNKREVNHIDSNKLNPRRTNLEWNTSKENVQHALNQKIKA